MAPTAVDTGTDTGTTPASFLPLASSPATSLIAPETSQPVPAAQPSALPSPGGVPSAPGANPDAYNPLAAQPYSPPDAAPVTPLPQTQLGPDQPANGAVNHAGAIAYGLDQILRGFMRGRATAQAVSAINLQKQSTGLQKNLDMASQQYYAMARAGTDPNSPEMQAAKSQVDAAWQSQMDFMKQHVAGEQIDKKTGQLKPQATPLLQRLTNGQDPAAQSVAVYQAAQKLGPPVYHQAAAFQTPAYQAYARTQAQTAGQTAQAQLSAAQLQATKGQQEQEYNKLAVNPNRTPEEDQKFTSLGEALDKPGSISGRVKDDMSAQIGMMVKTGQISQEEGIRRLAMLNSKSSAGLFLKQPQAGTKGFLQQKYAESIYGPGASPAQLNAAQLSYIDQVDAYNKVHSTVSKDQHLVPYVSNGRAGVLPMTTINTRGVAGAPQPPAGSPFIDDVGAVPTQQAQGAVENPILPPGATPAAGAAAATTHANALSNGASPKTAVTAARLAAKRAQKTGSSAPGVLPGDPPGFIPTNEPRKQTPDETKAYNEEDTIGKQLTAASQAAQLPNKAAGDKALGAAFARSQVGGRLSNFDIQRFTNMGSARMRLEGGVLQNIEGTMTDEQRNMILQNMTVNYKAAHELAEHYRNGDAGTGQRRSKTTAPAAAAAPSTTAAPPPAKSGVDQFFIPAPAPAH